MEDKDQDINIQHSNRHSLRLDECDHLQLHNDPMLGQLFDSVKPSNRPQLPSEDLLYSNECQMLSFDYETYKLDSKIDLVILITNYALYIFPQRIAQDNKQVLIYNSYDRFAIEEVAVTSLPYSQHHSLERGEDVALRTEDLALHFHDSKTLWLRVSNRSELVQILSDSYAQVTGGYPLDINHVEYQELIESISLTRINEIIGDVKCDLFSLHQSLLQGALYYATASIESLGHQPWTRKWFFLTRFDLWFFDSKAECEAFQYALSKPPKQRANLPMLGRIPLTRRVHAYAVEYESGAQGFKLWIPEQKKTMYFIPVADVSNNETCEEKNNDTENEGENDNGAYWALAIEQRAILYIESMLT